MGKNCFDLEAFVMVGLGSGQLWAIAGVAVRARAIKVVVTAAPSSFDRADIESSARSSPAHGLDAQGICIQFL